MPGLSPAALAVGVAVSLLGPGQLRRNLMRPRQRDTLQ
jgi:hypothetical protein